MQKKLFVWDFHGVLEKGNDNAVLDISNKALLEFGFLERFTKKDAEKLSGLRWHQYFSFLLPREASSIHMDLQKRCFEISLSNWEIVKKNVSLNDGAKEVLEEIKLKGHHQILISNTTQKALEKYIDIVGINDYFPKGNFFGVDTHFNKDNSKTLVLKNYLKKNFFDFLVCIGDSPSDMALSKICKNSTSYLYSHPGRKHREVEADYKINCLKKILLHI